MEETKEFKFKLHQFSDISPVPKEGTKVDETIPRPRSGHRVVILGTNLYCFGGYNPFVSDYDDKEWQERSPLFKELWKFSLISRKWCRLESVDAMPNELASHAAFIYGPFMVVYGGTGTPFGEASSNSVNLCHLPCEKWQLAQTSGDTPEPMYGQGVCREGDTLYSVGGTKGFEYSLQVHKLDLKSMIWSRLTSKGYNESIFDRRYRHEIVEYLGNLLIFGGGTREDSFNLDVLPAFDLELSRWHSFVTNPDSSLTRTRCKGFPKPRKCHILVKYKNFVFIHGGTDGSINFGDFWRLDLRTMQWKRLIKGTPDNAFNFHSAAVTKEGCIYVFGGIKQKSQDRTNQVSHIWVDVPPLQSMAWEAILHYAPHIVNIDSFTLRNMGIPAYIVNAIRDHPSDVG